MKNGPAACYLTLLKLSGQIIIIFISLNVLINMPKFSVDVFLRRKCAGVVYHQNVIGQFMVSVLRASGLPLG